MTNFKKKLNDGFELITIENTYGGLRIVGTQEYSEEFNIGHNVMVMFDKKGNILYVTQSTCGVPKGKLTFQDLEEFFKSRTKFGELIEEEETHLSD